MKDKFYEMAKNAILSDIETRNTEEFLDRIYSNKYQVIKIYSNMKGVKNDGKKSTIL